jgi:hypothetical protein
MKYGLGDSMVYLCNFCGQSSRKSNVDMLISSFDEESAICEPCARVLPVTGAAPVPSGGSFSMVPRDDAGECAGPVALAAPDAPQAGRFQRFLGAVGELLIAFIGRK